MIIFQFGVMTRTSVLSDKNVPLPSAKVRSGGGGNGGSWCYSSKFLEYMNFNSIPFMYLL
jgi:hypothetical protein